MKKVVQDIEIMEEISITQALNAKSYQIVTYETKDQTGLAVLGCYQGGYGFVYHLDLVINKNLNIKYKSRSYAGAIRKALDAGKRVLLFDDFPEFTGHASKLSKL